MPSERLIDALNEQVAHEFAASQQYVAFGVFYDSETLPQLAGFFYGQSVEERNHAMILVQYMLDVGARAVIPAIEAPRNDFSDLREPVALALDQERTVSDAIVQLMRTARDEGDITSEIFLQWFVKEQVEEVSTMSALLQVVERNEGRMELVEEYIARENPRAAEDDPTAPEAAGGAL